MEHLKNAKARISEANELIERAISFEKLSTIERDIILTKLAKAYECLLTGKSVDSAMPERDEVRTERVVKQPEAVRESVRVEPKSTLIEEDMLRIEEPIAKPEKTEIVSQPKVHVQKEAKPVELDTHDTEEHAQGEILAEKFKGKQKFRNEIIAEHSAKKDVSSKLQNKPISDLAKAIGINDKFLFTKELFDGDSVRYAETIGHLNSLSDLNDAIIFLQDNFQWPEDNESAVKFIDLVRRKFI
ncbi:hypothetical protein CYCD_03110 [Tenuifilaceae bacterium CYCD]|nr:hypothetical protein CYCD_03110 [Tenuifilaceae bacterium CYCD]